MFKIPNILLSCIKFLREYGRLVGTYKGFNNIKEKIIIIKIKKKKKRKKNMN